MTLHTAQRYLESFSSLWRWVSQRHSAGKAGSCQALWGTESVTGVLLGSCNISAHSSAFPQRLLHLRRSHPFGINFHQQKLKGYGEVGFRTGKKKLDLLNTSENNTFNKEDWSTNWFLLLTNLHLLVTDIMFWHCSTRECKENTWP